MVMWTNSQILNVLICFHVMLYMRVSLISARFAFNFSVF